MRRTGAGVRTRWMVKTAGCGLCCVQHTHTHTHTSWWIDITGNQIDLKRQWFIKRNGAYNMLWTTGLSPSTARPAGEGSFWTKKKKAAMKRASEKRKKTLNAIPSGFTPWPPPLESDRLSSASRPPPPRHIRTREHIIQYSTDECVCVCVFWKHFDVKICTVFDKPFRFPSIVRLCDPRPLHCC